MSKQRLNNVPKLVRTMFDAQDGNCGYCGRPMFIRKDQTNWYYDTFKMEMATFEHIVLASEGGRYVLENGACVCARCNGLRANLPLEEFFDRYDELLQHLLEKPARDAAKKAMNLKKNGYIVAWYCKIVGITVEDFHQAITN